MIPFLEYMLNKDYIAKELCKQKDDKQNTCNGKCHLRTQLEIFNEEAPNDKKNLKLEKTEILFIEEFNAYNFAHFVINTKQLTSFYLVKSYDSILNIPYPPPNFI